MYPVLKLLEDAGKLRRGYFIEGLGATQLHYRGRKRACVHSDAQIPTACRLSWRRLTAANPFGATLPWPSFENLRPARANKCHVVVLEGKLLAYSSSDGRAIHLNPAELSKDEQEGFRRATVAFIAHFERSRKKAWVLERINDELAVSSVWTPVLVDAGLLPSSKGLLYRRRMTSVSRMVTPVALTSRDLSERSSTRA